MRTYLKLAIVGLALPISVASFSGAARAEMLQDGQSVIATFNSGRLKGQTFTLRYSEKSSKLGDRPVTHHTKKVLAIKTPGGWCKFSSNGRATCHNGKGVWKAK